MKHKRHPRILASLLIVAAVAFCAALLPWRARSSTEVAGDSLARKMALLGEELSQLQLRSSRVAASDEAAEQVNAAEAGSEVRGAPSTPQNLEELRHYVAWLRSLPREQLLLASNAEFGFQDSELISVLHALKGEWVVPGLGVLAVAETEPLLQAILVEGLFGFPAPERYSDPAYVDTIRALLPRMSMAEADPHGVAHQIVFGLYSASHGQGADYAEILVPSLESSDNKDLLVTGYLLLGSKPGSESALIRALSSHASPEGRFGALEGVREAGLSGRIPPQDVARLGVESLASETSDRNRLLLVEMIGSAGGEDGLRALEEMVARGEAGLAGSAASMLALKSDPGAAQAVIEAALASGKLSPADRASVYQALGAVPGERSGEVLKQVAGNVELSEEERLEALQGLWNRPVDEGLRKDLSNIVESDAPGALRAESMRMLAFGSSDEADGSAKLEARKLAVLDRDPTVRREAVMLSALEPSADNRGWLEERFLNDRSPEVKAAALGALVVQAHYTGDGDSVRNHLERTRKMTGDPEVHALIDRGMKMVDGYDPRRVDLQLKKDAELYKRIAPLTSGPARQALERQGQYYQRMVDALGAITTGSPR